MGFKEDLEARRQREEAKRYFRSNNPYYFSSETWLKLVIVGILVALGCGVLYGLFTMLISIRFSYILGLVGVVIAKALKKISRVGNEKLGILCVVLYFFSLVFSNVVCTTVLNLAYGGSLAVLFNGSVWLYAFTEIFTGSIFSGIIYVMGALYAYNYASQ